MTDRWTAETEELVREHAGVYQVNVEAILTALDNAGLLLPPGGETREEAGTRIGSGEVLTMAEAGTRYTISTQSRRVRTVWTGPWRDVPDGPWVAVSET